MVDIDYVSLAVTLSLRCTNCNIPILANLISCCGNRMEKTMLLRGIGKLQLGHCGILRIIFIK
jgi:hypothetical protein